MRAGTSSRAAAATMTHARQEQRASGWTVVSTDPFIPAAPAGRLLVVSNRLPVTVRLDGDELSLVPSCGGLATGLRGVHERGGARWLGWSGVPAELPVSGQRTVDRLLADRGAVGIAMSAREISRYYQGYSNGVLWPVLHDRPDLVDLDPADWESYQAVNARFADAVARELRPGDRVWIHDYHLMLVPRLLRERCPEARIGFFLHTPFPSAESLRAIPQCAALLDGLLGADVVGLHTGGYAARLVEAMGSILGRGGNAHEVADAGRRVRIQACPMSVDVDAFESLAANPAVAARAAELRRSGASLLLGVDRLDYSKGIPERLRAFARLLEVEPERRGRVRLFQLAVPSREEVPAYRVLRAEVESLVASINERFGHPGWTPVEYRYGSVDSTTLAALYRAADVMLVTPLRDGMNLVAKEFVASRPDQDGVLVLSERAGAAAELRTALLVDPTDMEGLASGYATALSMSAAERRVRMRRMRAVVRRHDVHQWARVCLLSLGNDRAGNAVRTAG